MEKIAAVIGICILLVACQHNPGESHPPAGHNSETSTTVEVPSQNQPVGPPASHLSSSSSHYVF